MRNGERAFIYGGLVLAVGLGVGYRGLSAQAWAAPSARVAEPVAAKIAVVDMMSILEVMFGSSGVAATLNAEKAKLQPLVDMITGMETRLQKLDQNSPEFKGEMPAYQAKMEELKKGQNEFAAFQGRMVGDLYKQATAAAKTVGTAGGYTMVVTSRPVDAPFNVPNVEVAVQEILRRSVMFTGESTDITAAVMKELKIEAPKPAVAVPAVPAGPAGPGAGAGPGVNPAAPSGPEPKK